MILRPVLSRASTAWPARARAAGARALARGALAAAGRSARAPVDFAAVELPRDAAGAPLPVSGWYWSYADTVGLVAGLVAPLPCAIDAEWLGRERWECARARFEEAGELAGLGASDRPAVLALWSAKEALLKLRGVGLADLARCVLVEASGPDELLLAHRGRESRVRLHRGGEHVVAVACDEPFELRVIEIGPQPAEVAG